MSYINGATIKKLREGKGLTQKELAEKLMVSDKTVSKWETGRGLPDISMLGDLTEALGISVAELLTDNVVINRNRSSNMLRSGFYICPICGNVIVSSGEAVHSCCGITLPAMENDPDNRTAHGTGFRRGLLRKGGSRDEQEALYLVLRLCHFRKHRDKKALSRTGSRVQVLEERTRDDICLLQLPRAVFS